MFYFLCSVVFFLKVKARIADTKGFHSFQDNYPLTRTMKEQE